MTIEIAITVVFLLTSMGMILLAERAKNSIGLVHMLFFLVFVNGLHLAGLIENNDRHYDLTYYLLTHIVVLFYLGLFTIGILWLKGSRFAPSQDRIFKSAMDMRNGWLFAAFLGWLAVKAFLVLRYGASAFSLLSHLQGKDAISHFYAWWEAPIEFYARAFAVGASGVYVVKTLFKKGFWYKYWPVTGSFLVFFTVYVGTHSSVVGPRRFMLLLVIFGLVTIAWRHQKRVSSFLVSKWRVFLLTSIILLGAASYYQTIRNNFFQPDIADKLLSHNPLTFVKGLAQAMIPVPESERINSHAAFFREGPWDIVYDVIQRRGDGNPGTNGAITANAFASVVPRIIAGKGKKDVNADDFLENKMSIAPTGPYLAPDLATSLLAILMADFGYIGVLIAPAVMLFALTLFSYIPQRGILATPLLILFFFSALLNLSANVEGSLVPILSTFRDAAILILALLPFSFLSNSSAKKAPKHTTSQYLLQSQKRW